MLRQYGRLPKAGDRVPVKSHFAILVFGTRKVTVPGNDPPKPDGFGYNEPTWTGPSPHSQYWVVDDWDALKAAVEYLESRKMTGDWSSYRVLSVKPIKVKTRIAVELSDACADE